MHRVAARPYLYNGGLCCLAHGLVKISGCLPEGKNRKKKKGKIETCVIVSVQFKDFEAVSEG